MNGFLRALVLFMFLSVNLTFAQATFQHVIIIVQENRTPDNLFQGLCSSPSSNLCPTTYNISPNGVTPSGQPIALTADPLWDDLDPDHRNASFVPEYNGGGINQGPPYVSCTLGNSPYCCPNGAPSCMMINGVTVYNWLHYVSNDLFNYKGKNYNRLDPYLQLATQFGWANYFFQTNQGPSMPAHQFLLAGTSAPTAPPQSFFDGENPPSGSNNYNSYTGCTAPPGETVALIDQNGLEIHDKNNHKYNIYPCFDHKTLTDLLDAAQPKLSWKYYTTSAKSIWTAPNAIQHICDPTPTTGPGDVCVGQDWTQDVLPYIGPGKVLTDLGVGGSNNTACQLPAVSWVIPDGTWSDHGGIDDGYGPLDAGFGPAWVADIVDAVGGYDNQGSALAVQCGYWNNTAVLITWDDWGGWYDHVEPFSVIDHSTQWGSGYVYGFRVPFIFVSAYTPQGFVSGTVSGNGKTCTDSKHCYDFGSILQFIELNFRLGEIAETGYHYADHFANALDVNFYKGAARTFVPIPTPVPQSCFINPSESCFTGYTGPVDPDDDATQPN
jgi:hypothetical protein